jgi:N-methylhydantoinase A/oxoprolinase/acetone carboxylase beta subunit
VKTGLIVTDGFRDLLEIGRQKRPSLYDMNADKPQDLVTATCAHRGGGARPRTTAASKPAR